MYMMTVTISILKLSILCEKLGNNVGAELLKFDQNE